MKDFQFFMVSEKSVFNNSRTILHEIVLDEGKLADFPAVCHGVYVAEKPMLHEEDCEAGKETDWNP